MKIKVTLLVLILNLSAFSQTDTNESKNYKSPTKAMLMSAVIPGLGQFYNESYWKIPIIYGLASYFIYEFVENDKNYRYYRNLFIQSLGTSSGGDYRYKRLRDFYRDQRDLFGLYLLGLYLANILDAYVDAHLYNFDVGDKLSLRLLPSGIKLQYSF